MDIKWAMSRYVHANMYSNRTDILRDGVEAHAKHLQLNVQSIHALISTKHVKLTSAFRRVYSGPLQLTPKCFSCNCQIQLIYTDLHKKPHEPHMSLQSTNHRAQLRQNDDILI